MISKLLASDNIIQSGNIIASIENVIVEQNGNTLHLSIDGGKTYCKSMIIPAIGVIKHIHIFSDYGLLLCTAQKAYYSTDWEQLTESTVFGIDGNAFVPTTVDNFTITSKVANQQMLGNTEVLCWGNYSTDVATEYININIWYTVDKGQTIKSCFKFGTSIPYGGSAALAARHVHHIDFNPVDNTFWCQTGDEDTTVYSHWLVGAYNTSTDVWTWTLIGSGNAFKTGNMMFYGDYVYVSWDIFGGGIKRCLYSDMGNSANHEQILVTPNDCLTFFIGERGDMLVLISKWGGTTLARTMYYSTDLINFHTVIGEMPEEVDAYDTCYFGFWKPNSNGKILSSMIAASEDAVNFDMKPSVWLDDMLKRAGYPDAFKPL
jgi:hypothetical protein